MLKNCFLVFAALYYSLFLYSCTSSGSGRRAPQRCENNSDCASGYECQNGFCQSVIDVEDAALDKDETRDIVQDEDEIRDTALDEDGPEDTESDEADLRDTVSDEADLGDTVSDEADLRDTESDEADLRDTVSDEDDLRDTSSESEFGDLCEPSIDCEFGYDCQSGTCVDVENARWQKPPGAGSIYFIVDDRANRTYRDGQLIWKGSFDYDGSTNMLYPNSSWSGPYPTLYDDGSYLDGGHEAAGQIAGDHIFSCEVFIIAEYDILLEYGLTDENNNWIWTGSGNGLVEISAGETGRVEAPGMVL